LDEEKSDISLDSDSVKSILTLRYAQNHKGSLPQLGWRDFQPSWVPNTNNIQDIITKYLKARLPLSTKELSIAQSGGIDSTIVLYYLRKTFPNLKINAISIRFSESEDETEDAKRIADHFECAHHIIHVENFLKELPKAVHTIKLPFWDMHWYYVAAKAKHFSKYIASGDGGDELFGGYTFRYSKFISSINSSSTPIEKTKAYLNCHIRDHVPDQDGIFGPKIKFSWDDFYKNLLLHFDNPLEPIDQVFLADYNGKLLHNFSIVNSSINENLNLQSVTPLLSQEMLQMTHCPNKLKYDKENNLGKLLLRKILKDNNLDKLVSSKKRGFSMNTVNLWKSYGNELCNQYLDNGHIISEGLIDKDWIAKYLNKRDLDVRYINKFLGILALEVWYRIFVSKDLSPNKSF
jgi:asparagine synthase (glutamine-hydrolysing)